MSVTIVITALPPGVRSLTSSEADTATGFGPPCPRAGRAASNRIRTAQHFAKCIRWIIAVMAVGKFIIGLKLTLLPAALTILIGIVWRIRFEAFETNGVRPARGGPAWTPLAAHVRSIARSGAAGRVAE